ncbi:MAG TPA: amidohydrolase family protein [Candidatus Acidoferrum sp.]|nr:amidohydrolase family protein [Candidatus Acidoferrum sp.]
MTQQDSASILPSIDSHHHLWDLAVNHYPWLVGPPVEAHFGPYEKIRKNYLVRDYLNDIRGQAIVKSVHIEAGCDPSDPVKETRWLQAQADRHGFPHGIVAHANLAAENVREMIEAHCRFPNVRGVRMMMRPPGQLRRGHLSGGSPMNDSAWRRGFSILGEMNLSFDLQAPPPLMADAAGLAASFPNTQLVLTHAGLPLDRTADGMAAWRKGMHLLAEQPNVVVKVSGIPMTDWRWTLESLQPIVLETIDFFGIGRTMFGSNFPVDKLYGDYASLWGAYRQIAGGFTLEEQRCLFHDNAQRVYRL